MNKFITLIVLLSFVVVRGQQLNCTLSVNSQKLNNSNQQVFKTLQSSLTDFVNKTDWNGKFYKQNEKINCSMIITIESNSANQFDATIQVQSSRPIYNSIYSSPVFNYNDKNFGFTYTEYESLLFNPTVFESNLVSVISFYCYVILGLDKDSFELQSGNSDFEIAQNIANLAQQSGNKGWSQLDGNQNRYFLINDLLSGSFSQIRKTAFEYHTGLDLMASDLKAAKEKIKAALINISILNSSKPNAFLTRIFFDAKSDEIVSIFSGGPTVGIADLIENMDRVSPINSSKWATMKF